MNNTSPTRKRVHTCASSLAPSGFVQSTNRRRKRVHTVLHSLARRAVNQEIRLVTVFGHHNRGYRPRGGSCSPTHFLRLTRKERWAIIHRGTGDPFQSMACGFGFPLRAAMAHRDAGRPASIRLAPEAKHISRPRAKRVISIFMQGGPSPSRHVRITNRIWPKYNGPKTKRFDDAPRAGEKRKKIIKHRVFESPWKFKQYGKCGASMFRNFSPTLPSIDRLCFLSRGSHRRRPPTGPSTLFFAQTINLVRPSDRAVDCLYGLGRSENENRPVFVRSSHRWANGGPHVTLATLSCRLPFQGTAVGRAGCLPKMPKIQKSLKKADFEKITKNRCNSKLLAKNQPSPTTADPR